MSVNPYEPRLARVAAMIADPARSRMLSYLMGGESATAGELARAATVTASTASGHLAKLEGSGFLVCEQRGRHRYYRLADAEIAHALEALALIAERGGHERAWASPERRRLRQARCCYGHIAGRLGVALFDCLRRDDCLRPADAASDHGLELTARGEDWLAGLGLVVAPARVRQRFAYGCLDWSERRDHLAGSLANQMLLHFVAQDWLRRGRDGQRVLTVTPTGQRQLLPRLGLASLG